TCRGWQLAQCDALRNAGWRLHGNDDFETPLVIRQRIDERAGSFAGCQSRARQHVAQSATLCAELLDEVIAIRHEWPHGDGRVRARALDDLRHFGPGWGAQLNERGVIRPRLARVAILDFLRELSE